MMPADEPSARRIAWLPEHSVQRGVEPKPQAGPQPPNNRSCGGLRGWGPSVPPFLSSEGALILLRTMVEHSVHTHVEPKPQASPYNPHLPDAGKRSAAQTGPEAPARQPGCPSAGIGVALDPRIWIWRSFDGE